MDRAAGSGYTGRMRWEFLVAAIIGAVFGAGAATLLSSDAVQAVPILPAGKESTAVLEELRGIRSLLEQPDLERPTPIAERIASTSPAAAPRELDTAALTRAIDRLIVTLSTSPRWTEEVARPGDNDQGERVTRTIDLEAVRPVFNELEVDVNATVPEYFGLSPAEVYRRFGTPSRIGSSAGRVRWFYDEPGGGGLQLTFMDGYLAWLTRRDP